MKQFKWLSISASLLLTASLAACGPRSQTDLPQETAPPSATAGTTASPQAEPGGRSKLTGLPLEPDQVDRRVISVMFDNHPAARPQAGVSQADVMFEIKVEGTYTRYMGLFQSRDADRIGPVRSARDCFIDRSLEYNAVYAHFGGSYLALNRIEQFIYPDLNGMTNAGGAMFRDDSTGKTAPHNVFTSTAKLKEAAASRDYADTCEIPGLASFNKEAVKPTEGAEPATNIAIQYASDNRTDYKWSEKDQAYLRYKDGVQDVDEGSENPWLAANIIIQEAPSYIEPAPLRTVEQIGQGKGFYISQGAVVPITWEKNQDIASTYYFTADGQPLSLNPGQTWIQVVDPDTPVEIN